MPRAVTGLLVLVLGGACSGGRSSSGFAARSTTPTEVPTTLATATTSTTATTVPGTPRTTTSTTVVLGPGRATISGTVNGPDGPVDGATVRIERVVGQKTASTELRSAGGAFTLPLVLGGAYRVRAWRAPDLAQAGTDVFFLAADEDKRLEINLLRYGPRGVLATVDPDPPKVDQPATLSVRLGDASVDDEGQVSTTPKGGIALVLTVGPGVVLESSAQVVSDEAGAASWRFRCTAPGPFSASLAVAANPVTPIGVPACAAP